MHLAHMMVVEMHIYRSLFCLFLITGHFKIKHGGETLALVKLGAALSVRYRNHPEENECLMTFRF